MATPGVSLCLQCVGLSAAPSRLVLRLSTGGRSCSPGSGSRQPNTYRNAPTGPVYPVSNMNPHLRTGDAGVVRMSTTTNNSEIAASTNHRSITPSSILVPPMFLLLTPAGAKPLPRSLFVHFHPGHSFLYFHHSFLHFLHLFRRDLTTSHRRGHFHHLLRHIFHDTGHDFHVACGHVFHHAGHLAHHLGHLVRHPHHAAHHLAVLHHLAMMHTAFLALLHAAVHLGKNERAAEK